MKPAQASLLFNPIFVCSLSVLLLNDFYWKHTYGNWVTGKLSDAAGIMVLPVLLFALFPNAAKWLLAGASALFFVWWKSDASQPLINYLNDLSIPLHRIVDATDCFVLPLLVVACRLRPTALPFRTLYRQVLHYSLALVTLFSLCSTSYYRELSVSSPANEVLLHEEFKVEGSEEALLQKLQAKGVALGRDSVVYGLLNNRNQLFYKTLLSADSIVWKPLPEDSVIYVRRNRLPFYVIPVYQATNRQLRNIRFRLSSNKKKTKTFVDVESFETEVPTRYWMDKKVLDDYKALLRVLFGANK